jgi:2-dehydro-3-deoxyglucarate aldolase
MFHDFRARLRAREPLLGTMMTLPASAVAEVLAGVGFDWLFLDAEHGAIDAADVLDIVRAVDHSVPCLVRLPAADETWVKRALDAGAAGIIVPQVNSPDLAAEVVRWSRYAPSGARGVGLARAHGYGARFQEYLAKANDAVSVVVQIEHMSAVEQIKAILAVEGIDAVFVGPYDLSASLNRLGEIEHPEVVRAIHSVTVAAQSAGCALGYFGVSPESVAPYLERGYTLIAVGVDTLFLGDAAGRMLKALRPGYAA